VTTSSAVKQDKLRAACEHILGADENILLDAECSVYRRHWPFPALGSGRSFLTSSRLIWIRRPAPPGFEALSKLIAPNMIDIPLLRIERLTREQWGLNSFLLHLRSDVGEYFYRLGVGPFPLLRKNPETSDEWFETLNTLMKARGSPET
jgi:hypothetical protein